MELDADAVEKAYKAAAQCPPDKSALAREISMAVLRIKARSAVEKATCPKRLRAAIAALLGDAP